MGRDFFFAPDLKVEASLILNRFSSSPERSEGRIEKTSGGRCSRYATLLEHRYESGFRVVLSEARIYEKTNTIGVLDTLRYSNTGMNPVFE